jgi:tetratricopeptide (TPR) repeat protein
MQSGAQEAKENGEKQDWFALQTAGRAAFKAGHYAEALEDFEQSLSLARTPEERAMALKVIGYSLRGLGRQSDGLRKMEQALLAWQEIDPAGHGATETAVWIGNELRASERYIEAERALRAALSANPRENEDRAMVLNALAHLLLEEGRFLESREKFSIALNLSSAGDDRINALLGLGEIERATREWGSAIGHVNEARALAREIKEPVQEAVALRSLGNNYADMGDFAKAEPLLRRALTVLEADPTMRSQYESTLVSLGFIYEAEKKPGLAEDAFTRALAAKGGLDAADARSMPALEALATIHAQQKRFAEAEDLADRAYRVTKEAFGAESAPAAGSLGNIAFVEQLVGHFESAERNYSEALRILRNNGLLNSDLAAGIMSAYAVVLRKLHRRSDAKAIEAELKGFRPGARAN